MATDKFTNISVVQTNRLKKKLSFVKNLARDEEALFRAARLLLTRIRKRFKAQVDSDGNKWTPLSDSTKDKYSRAGILRYAQSKLFDSIKVASDEPFKTNTGLGMRITAGATSKRPSGIYQYGLTHQGKNGRRVHKNVPIRPFLGVNDDDAKAIRRSISAFWQSKLDRI